MKKGILLVIIFLMLLSITACADIRNKTKLEKFMEELEDSGFECSEESMLCIYKYEDVIDKPDVYSAQNISYIFDLKEHVFNTRVYIFGTNNTTGYVYEDDRNSIYNYEDDTSYTIVNKNRYDCQTNKISFSPSVGARQLEYDCDTTSPNDIYYYVVALNCPVAKQQCNVAKNNMSSYMGDYTISDLLEEKD